MLMTASQEVCCSIGVDVEVELQNKRDLRDPIPQEPLEPAFKEVNQVTHGIDSFKFQNSGDQGNNQIKSTLNSVDRDSMHGPTAPTNVTDWTSGPVLEGSPMASMKGTGLPTDAAFNVGQAHTDHPILSLSLGQLMATQPKPHKPNVHPPMETNLDDMPTASKRAASRDLTNLNFPKLFDNPPNTRTICP